MKDRKNNFNNEIYVENPAKSTPHSGHRAKVREKYKNKRRKRVGRTLVVLQLLLTLVFIWTMLNLSIIPIKFLAPIVIGLLILLWIINYSQKRSNWGAAVGKVVSVLIIICLGVGSYYLTIIDNAFDKITVGDNTDNLTITTDLTEEPFHIYISGNDVFGSIDKSSRSDVNIIVTVNPNSNQVLLTTTPRDAYVVIPEVSNGQKDKLTHAGNHGVKASMATLSNLYETEISLYVRVNFSFILDIVEELGGIDVYSEYEFTTIDGHKVKKGMNHFNGEEALAFCRERKGIPGGDNQRGKNQQAFIVALAKKMLSPKMLLSAGSIIESVSDSVDTNIPRSQMEAWIVKQLGSGSSWKISSIAAEGTGASEYTYSIPNKKVYVTKLKSESVQSIIDLMNRVENGEKIEGSETIN